MANNIPVNLFEVLGDTAIKKRLLTTIQNVIPSITDEDIQRSVKTRYFAKYTTQRNGLIYEIDGGQYSSIQNNSLFLKTTIDWIIRGKLEDTVLTLPSGDNILIKGVVSQNKTLISLAEEELPGITNHLRNYVEFWSGE
jgi:c-di-AMP phosphodiesterase-like protein